MINIKRLNRLKTDFVYNELVTNERFPMSHAKILFDSIFENDKKIYKKF